MKTLFTRIIFDLILLIAVFFVPWWLWLVLVTISVFVINLQYEIIFIAFIADSALGGGSVDTDFRFVFMVSSALIFLVSIFLKPRLKFYNNSL